jgi:hypothetical protein
MIPPHVDYPDEPPHAVIVVGSMPDASTRATV